jgi:hypothetical protein
MALKADDILVDDRFSKDNWWPTPPWAQKQLEDERRMYARQLMGEFMPVPPEPERGVPFLVVKQRMPIPADATPIPIDWERASKLVKDIRRAVCGPLLSRPDAEWSDDTP